MPDSATFADLTRAVAELNLGVDALVHHAQQTDVAGEVVASDYTKVVAALKTATDSIEDYFTPDAEQA